VLEDLPHTIFILYPPRVVNDPGWGWPDSDQDEPRAGAVSWE
jgi:hypothetical protein